MKTAVFDELNFDLDELNFDLDELKFDLDETVFGLDRDQLLNRRWKQCEKAMRKAMPLITAEYRDIGDDVIQIADELKLDPSKLDKKVPNNIRRKVEKRMSDWKREGIFRGYLEFLGKSLTHTFRDVLFILIFGCYLMHMKKIERIANDVFKVSAVSAYGQALQELPEEKKTGYTIKKITNKTVEKMVTVPILDLNFHDYLQGESLTQADEMKNFVLTITMQAQDLDEEVMRTRIVKQRNRILLVREDKFSGTLNDTARVVANNAYIANFMNIPKLQVRFIAEMDEKTTKMCRSLDLQLFYINDWNHFERYSETHKKHIRIDLFGLMRGVNLPPITDHFHWCRSTITYDIDNILEAKKKLHEDLKSERTVGMKSYQRNI